MILVATAQGNKQSSIVKVVRIARIVRLDRGQWMCGRCLPVATQARTPLLNCWRGLAAASNFVSFHNIIIFFNPCNSLAMIVMPEQTSKGSLSTYSPKYPSPIQSGFYSAGSDHRRP